MSVDELTRARVTLASSHNIVWQFREAFKDELVLPTVEETMFFAFCELAESIDADLRKNPKFLRTRPKDLDERDELADYAFNLLTAIGPNAVLPSWWTLPHNVDHGWYHYIDDISSLMIAQSLEVHRNYKWRDLIWDAVWRVASHPEMELLPRLGARLVERGNAIFAGKVASMELQVNDAR